MFFRETKFKGVWLIEPKIFEDERGLFFESFSWREFKKNGIADNFIQDNQSKSVRKGVLRGLHFQLPPYAQAKLVRVIKGSVFDVIVDLRKKSETFGQWGNFNLSEKNRLMLYIPRGFAHGFLTMKENTEFLYKVDNGYVSQAEGGIIWNDPELNIDWPIKDPVLSEKDKILKNFSKQKLNF